MTLKHLLVAIPASAAQPLYTDLEILEAGTEVVRQDVASDGTDTAIIEVNGWMYLVRASELAEVTA